MYKPAPKGYMHELKKAVSSKSSEKGFILPAQCAAASGYPEKEKMEGMEPQLVPNMHTTIGHSL